MALTRGRLQQLRKNGVAILASAGLAGCAELLPQARVSTQQAWKDFDEASAAITRIVPRRTTRADLATAGIELGKNPSITLLTLGDVMQRFAVGGALESNQLDPDVRACVIAGKSCNGYSITVRHNDRNRVGNFWLDAFNFRRETDLTGWNFNALILFVDDTVVYAVHGGQPRIHEKEVNKNPLGPLQSFGEAAGSLLRP
jgi:hypothetical protein